MMPEVWQAFMLANPGWWIKMRYFNFRLNGVRIDQPKPRPINTIPKISDDPRIQNGFAKAYKGREWMLRESNDAGSTNPKGE